MRRQCDGTEPTLIRRIPAAMFDDAAMTISPRWARLAGPGEVVIQCQCGLAFDDEHRRAVWPHEFYGQGELLPDTAATRRMDQFLDDPAHGLRRERP